jgi:hypothetical protein
MLIFYNLFVGLSRHFICAREVSRRYRIFCSLCKKIFKKCLMILFYTKLYIFTKAAQNIGFFSKRFCEHVGCTDVRATI